MDLNEIFQWFVLVFLFVDAAMNARLFWLDKKIHKLQSERMDLIEEGLELLESKMDDIHPDVN